MYRLPQRVGQFSRLTVQSRGDCAPVATSIIGQLEKDARLRVWPADSPWIKPESFGYPVKQSWFASQTSFSNEPVAPRPNRQLYYHAGLDIGGAEALTEVVAATDAVIVSHGLDVHPDHAEDTPIQPRYDVLYLDGPTRLVLSVQSPSFFRSGRSRLGQVVQHGRPTRFARQGRRQRGLDTPALRDQEPTTQWTMGDARWIRVPLAGLPSAEATEDSCGGSTRPCHLCRRVG